jgi:glycosyltransferase involved in cell wall biosynthesis
MPQKANRPSGSSRACIVIPCYNEAARLRSAEFLEFAATHNQIAFLFVNDGSKDGTLDLLQELCSKHVEGLFYLDLQPNCGKAEAVRLGILRAIELLQPEFVGFWDADLATPLNAIPDFLEILRERDQLQMVFGARIRLLGHQVRRKLARHYLGRIFATVVSIALRLPVYDTQCGAKIFRVTPDLLRILAEPFLSRWIFDVEIVARVIQEAHGDREHVEEMIFELPLMRWEDVAGSKLHPTDFFRALLEIYAIRRKHTG